MAPLLKMTSSGLIGTLHLDSLPFQFYVKGQTGCDKKILFKFIPKENAMAMKDCLGGIDNVLGSQNADINLVWQRLPQAGGQR